MSPRLGPHVARNAENNSSRRPKTCDLRPKTVYHEFPMSTATNGRPVDTTKSPTAWSVHDASELYEVARWGNGYFSINPAGHVQVHPTKDVSKAIDLKELV